MRLGEYTVEQPLGAGGMSLVWLARDPRGALVVLKRQLNPDDDERLREEGRIGLALHHEGIVQTFAMFEHEHRPVLVLEYVPGATLVALRKRGPLHPAAVCTIGADVAAGLAALHDARGPDGQPLRVLHRDVSPTNVIISADGRARLIDLGIARADASDVERTRNGELRGTVRYLAPELFDGRPHSAKSDLWALGVCLFEAALGRAAVTGPEAVILAAIVRGTLLQPHAGESIAAPLVDVIARLCAPEASRIESAARASVLLRDAARACGDGAAEAASAVWAVVATARVPSGVSPAPVALAPAVRGPGADVGDDAFVRFAASTYCATDDDDDDLFASDRMAATAVTPLSPTSASAPLARPPGSDPDAGPAAVDTALWTPPSSSPGSTPAGDDAWNIPRPTTGAGGDAPEPAPAPVRAAPVDVAAQKASDGDVMAELQESQRLPVWPIAAVALVVAALILAFVLRG